MDTGNTSVKAHRDFYVGLDDAQWVTGNRIKAELKCFVGVELEYNHQTEKNGKSTNYSASAYDGPFDMLFYPETIKSLNLSLGMATYDVINNEFKISHSISGHFLMGGHFSVGFNVSEFFRRVFD
ncbi:MAG: hypothetical protein IJW48_00035 [Clostridia bacterium]|nr:hypothetical protein [Clostridia bacterium]